MIAPLMQMYDLRPCKIEGKRALFHRWETWANVVNDGLLVGSHPGGQISYVVGIVEYENGDVTRVSPNVIQFCDGLVEKIWEQYYEPDKDGDTK